MDKINKDKVLAAFVRGFFEAFTSGIIDCHVKNPKEKFMPHVIKKTMLNYYESVGEVFNDTMFYPLACINYSIDEIERELRKADVRSSTMTDFVRIACRTEAIHKAMVAEYKRNFEGLLLGRNSKVGEHLKQYTRMTNCDTVPSDVAIALTARTVMLAYARGIRRGGTGKSSLHQATLFRLMLDAMTVLLRNEPLPLSGVNEETGLTALFLKACGSEHNFGIMTTEMGRTYSELVKSEGIISPDDQAN